MEVTARIVLVDSVRTIEDFLSLGPKDVNFLQHMTNPSRLRDRYERRVNIRKRKVGVYSPSGIGYCLAKQLFRRQGVVGSYNTKRPTQGIFDFGHALHAYWQTLDESIIGPDHYTAEVPVDLPELHMFGTCDAEIIYAWLSYLFEYKTINSVSFKTLVQPLPEHTKQLTAYLKARNRPFGWIRYICKGTGQVKDFFVPFVKAVWDQIEETLLHLENSFENGTPVEKSVGYQCGECRYILECNPYES